MATLEDLKKAMKIVSARKDEIEIAEQLMFGGREECLEVIEYLSDQLQESPLVIGAIMLGLELGHAIWAREMNTMVM